MKNLAIRVGVIVLLAALGSCAAGVVVARVGGGTGTAVAGLRDVGIVVLALISLVMAAAWGSIYFGGAWAIGRFGAKGLTATRWAGAKVMKAEAIVARGTEGVIVRPLAASTRAIAGGTAFLAHLRGGVPRGRPLAHEMAGLRTFVNRLRRAAVTADDRRPTTDD